MGLIRRKCKICGRNLQVLRETDKQGRKHYRSMCQPCHRRPWTRFKRNECEECGFIPESPRQLDVHHLDGDKTNNEPNNLVTVCANCHRLIHA